MKLPRLKNDGKPELKLNLLQGKMKKQIDLKVQNGNYQFEEITCPICGSDNNEPIGEKDRYGLFYPTNLCANCGLVFTNPRMNQYSYNEFYNSEYRKLYVGSETATETFFNNQKRKGEKIYDFLNDNNIINKYSLYVLEVGCGAGGIVDFFKEKGNKIKGIDLGLEYIKYGQSKHNLDLEVGTLKDLQYKEKPDLIIYSHVLEHILDLNFEIQLIKQLAHKDTVIYIEVPGVKEIHKNYESNILKYFQNAHTFHFTLESLMNLMSKNGFELIHGNQFIQSAFKLSEKPFVLSSDYENVNNYIKITERKRVFYPFTVRGFKNNLKKLIIKTLEFTNTREFAKRIKRTLTNNK